MLLCILGSLGISLFYALFFIDLFPLAEFRDWIADSMSIDQFLASLKRVILRDTLFDRHLSICFSRFAGLVGDKDIRVVNLVMLMPITGSCVFLYILSRQLKLSSLMSLVGLLLWGFSLPVIDAVAWQATSHDRLALFFALPAINVTIAFSRRRLSAGNLVSANLLILVCVVGAYNSKLSSLFLVPSLMLFVTACSEGGVGQRLSRLLLLVLPMAYGAFHNARYFYILSYSQGSSDHVMGRSFSNWNLIPSLNYALGYDSQKKSALCIVVAAGLLMILFISVILKRKRKGGTHQALRLPYIMWLCITFFMATFITFFTRYSTAYYQYIPRVFLVLLILQVIAFFFECLGPGRIPAISASLVSVALLAGSLLLFFYCFFPDYRVRSEISQNFIASFPEVRAHVDPHGDSPITLVTSAPAWRIYLFYGGSRRALLRYIFGDEAVAHLPWDESMQGRADVKEEEWESSSEERGYQLCYDSTLTLAAIYHNGKKIL
ncbi:MAG: hypothetical protein ABIK28_10695 [Planctomycetota bacterium]